MAPAVLMPGMVKLSPEVIKTVLKEKENLHQLAAALLWSRDESLWKNALEQMKSQPLVAATIAFSGRTDNERLEAAKTLISQQPSNSLGYVAALDCYIRLGDTPKINGILSNMPPGEKIDPYAMDMHSGLSELFDLAKYDPVQKGVLLSQDNWQLKIVESISGLSALCSEDVPPEEKSLRASLILNLIEGYRNSGEGFLPDAVLTRLSRAEELALRRIPDDYRLIDGSTVTQEASRLSSARIKEIESQRHISDALSTSDYKTVGNYYRILDTKGETAAKMWLIGE